jgi:hypothetical protein
VAEFRSPRRYYLHKRRYAGQICDGLELVWKAKQEAEPGAALPADFPHRERLQTAGYTTDSDLDGADERELVDVGFTDREAQAVLSAFDSLT